MIMQAAKLTARCIAYCKNKVHAALKTPIVKVAQTDTAHGMPLLSENLTADRI